LVVISTVWSVQGDVATPAVGGGASCSYPIHFEGKKGLLWCNVKTRNEGLDMEKIRIVSRSVGLSKI